MVNGNGNAPRGADVMVDPGLNSSGSFVVVANSAQAAAGGAYAGTHPVGEQLPVQHRNGAAYIATRDVMPSEALVLVNRP